MRPSFFAVSHSVPRTSKIVKSVTKTRGKRDQAVFNSSGSSRPTFGRCPLTGPVALVLGNPIVPFAAASCQSILGCPVVHRCTQRARHRATKRPCMIPRKDVVVKTAAWACPVLVFCPCLAHELCRPWPIEFLQHLAAISSGNHARPSRGSGKQRELRHLRQRKSDCTADPIRFVGNPADVCRVQPKDPPKKTTLEVARWGERVSDLPGSRKGLRRGEIR